MSNTEPLILDWSLAAAEIRAEDEAMTRELSGETLAQAGDRYEAERGLANELAAETAERERRGGVTEVDRFGRRVYTLLPADVADWLTYNPDDQFAKSLRLQFNQRGRLTEPQVEAVRKCIERGAERRAAASADTTVEQASEIKASLQRAKDSGLKHPRLRFAGFAFTLAGERSKNPGAVYVKDTHGKYLGKVVGNTFRAAWGVPAEVKDAAAKVLDDPKSAAIAYGKEYGICSCCGRDLTDPESVARGIGPICADRFGW